MYIFILALNLLMSCSSIKEPKQINIILFSGNDYKVRDTVIIKDNETLNMIAELISDKSKEPIKFLITYNIEFVYQDGTTKEYSGQGKWLRDKEGSYILPNDERLKKYYKLIKETEGN